MRRSLQWPSHFCVLRTGFTGCPPSGPKGRRRGHSSDRSRNISARMQDAPDITVVVVADVEHQIRKTVERPGPKFGSIYLEANRSEPVSGSRLKCSNARCNESMKFAAVPGGAFFQEMVARSSASFTASSRRATRAVTSGRRDAISQSVEVAVSGRSDRRRRPFAESRLQTIPVLGTTNEIAHVLARRAVVAPAHLRIDERLELVRQRHIQGPHE